MPHRPLAQSIGRGGYMADVRDDQTTSSTDTRKPAVEAGETSSPSRFDNRLP